MLFKILFPVLFIAGFYFLIKSIGKIIRIYGGSRVEFPATPSHVTYEAEKAGDYEIAYKRISWSRVIPQNIPFTLVNDAGEAVPVINGLSIFGPRKDLTGTRIVPIATFKIVEPGRYHLTIPEIPGAEKKDSLLIGAKTGSQGFLMIFAIVFSAITIIAGLVLSILAFMNKFE